MVCQSHVFRIMDAPERDPLHWYPTAVPRPAQWQNMFGESKKSTSGACFCLSSGLSSGAMEHFMVGMSQKAPSVLGVGDSASKNAEWRTCRTRPVSNVLHDTKIYEGASSTVQFACGLVPLNTANIGYEFPTGTRRQFRGTNTTKINKASCKSWRPNTPALAFQKHVWCPCGLHQSTGFLARCPIDPCFG